MVKQFKQGAGATISKQFTPFKYMAEARQYTNIHSGAPCKPKPTNEKATSSADENNRVYEHQLASNDTHTTTLHLNRNNIVADSITWKWDQQ